MASMEDLKKYLETSGYMLARGAKQFRENMPTVSGILGSPAEYLPGSGFVTGQRDLTEAARNAQTGNYGEAAIGAGNAALGYGSGILDMATLGAAALPRTMAKKAVEAVSEIAPEVIRAYHGSPYSFDKFDLSKIGSGEGAQAYGHGLYLAEAEPTAKYYRDTLAGNRNQIDLEYEANQRGMPMTREAMTEVIRQASGDAPPLQAAKQLQNASIEARKYPPEALADIIDVYRKSKKGSMYEVNILANPANFLDWDKPLRDQPDVIKKLSGWSPETIDAYRSAEAKDTDNLLAALEGSAKYTPAKIPRPKGALPMSATGAEIYENLKNKMGAIDWPIDADSAMRSQYQNSAAAKASEYLLKNEIPGIKYLDANSRGTAYRVELYTSSGKYSEGSFSDKKQAEQYAQKKEAEGFKTNIVDKRSNNYVVFDDAMIEILRKYGLIPAVGAAGYGLLGAQDQAQAQETR